MTILVPGDRVLCPDGWFGTVEEVDGRFVDVRFDTPDGEPSCVISCHDASVLVHPIPENVVQRPVSKQWRRKSAIFCAALTRILEEVKWT